MFNVMDYGANNSGVPMSPAAFHSAIADAAAQGGGKVLVPAGTYAVTAPIVIGDDDINLIGEGIEATRIVPAFAAAGVAAIHIYSADYVRIADLSVRGDRDGNNRVGAGIKVRSAYHPILERLNIEHCQKNVYLESGTPLPYAALLADLRTNFGDIGLQIGDDDDVNWWQNVFLRNCTFGAANVAGVRIYAVGGLQWNGGECIYNADNMQLMPGNNQKITALQVNNVFFDTPDNNNINANVRTNGTTGKIIDLTFTSCSINNAQNGYGAAFHGHQTGDRGVDVIKFVSCSFVINKTYGLYLEHSRNVTLTDCNFVSNGTAASNTYSGVNVGTRCDRVQVRGGMSGVREDFGPYQKHGIVVDWTVTNLTLDGFDVSSGNLTSGYQNLGSTTGLHIRNCPGIVTRNSSETPIVTGQTSCVVNHGLSVTPLREHIYLTPLQDFEGRRLWISSINATSFTVNMDAALPTYRYFAWHARVEL